MNIKKALWFSLGCILLVIAFIGVYLPGLPWSTPAVGAAFCFALLVTMANDNYERQKQKTVDALKDE